MTNYLYVGRQILSQRLQVQSGTMVSHLYMDDIKLNTKNEHGLTDPHHQGLQQGHQCVLQGLLVLQTGYMW